MSKVIRAFITPGALQRLKKAAEDSVSRSVIRRGLRVEAAAKALAPVDTGRLRSSIHMRIERRDGVTVCVISTNVKYAAYHEYGTGIYGPKRRPIRPVRAKRLVFIPKGGNELVFAKQVRGVKAKHFMKKALQAGK